MAPLAEGTQFPTVNDRIKRETCEGLSLFYNEVNMPAYKVSAKVDQVVTRTVHMVMKADSPEDAEKRARSILAEYPKDVPYDPEVYRVVTTGIDYYIPKSIDVQVREES
jgi:hypothetical protein